MLDLLVSAILLTQTQSQGDPPPLAAVASMRKVSHDAKVAGMGSAESDESGMIGFNKRDGYISVADQRGAAESLTMAVIAEDHEKIKSSFDTMRKTFALMNSDGTYPITAKDGRGANLGAQLGDTMAWLSEAVPALVRLQAYDPTFASQISKMKESVSLSAQFIHPRRSVLIRRAGENANWVFRDAKCFLYLGVFLNDRKYTTDGHEFLADALARQTRDGVFPEGGGADTNYQSVSLHHLCEIYMLEPKPETKAAIQKGADWYLARFTADGHINIAGNTRTAIGHSTSRGYSKVGNQAVPVSTTLALISTVLPNSKAGTTLEAFSKLAFKNGRPLKPIEYIIDGDQR